MMDDDYFSLIFEKYFYVRKIFKNKEVFRYSYILKEFLYRYK